ncbi:hypothetical protein TWF481_000743 [Arthrobotrys musiformis]|uniref:F-box domain-containing protein n=1 Tax=Arthrobotrys musiformis TaxID=47236 RepID=A0AAV9WNI0_9PEZI
MTSDAAVPPSNLHRPKPGTPSRILELPYDLYIEIFSHVSWRTHVTCMDVCKQWRQILSTPHARAIRFGTDTEPRVHQIFKSVFLRHTTILQIERDDKDVVSVRFKKSIDEYDDNHYADEDRLLWGKELWEPQHPILDDYLFSQGDMEDNGKAQFEFYRPSIAGVKFTVQNERMEYNGRVLPGWKISLDNMPMFRTITLREFLVLLSCHILKIPAFWKLEARLIDLLPTGVDDSSLLVVKGRLPYRDWARCYGA